MEGEGRRRGKEVIQSKPPPTSTLLSERGPGMRRRGAIEKEGRK